jgi:hypothetical protein
MFNKYNIQPKIIKGYKGIMDLDLTNVNIVFHKELIQQHYKDIELYKKEQENLKDELKYDNGVGLSLIKMEIQNKIIAERFKFDKFR